MGEIFQVAFVFETYKTISICKGEELGTQQEVTCLIFHSHESPRQEYFDILVLKPRPAKVLAGHWQVQGNRR